MTPSPEDVQMVRDWSDMCAEKMAEGLHDISVAFKSEGDAGPLRIVFTQHGGFVLEPGKQPTPVDEWLAARETS